ncbi:syntaxin-125-like [Silene latifolia]|uniref:syntaxin-125-like n=1 Tax=Silene latifolia TaxID=37657 RepID=UPI003D78753D
MNNLRSFSSSRHTGDIEMGSPGNLDKFYIDVEMIENDLKEIDEIQNKLRAAHEDSKTAHKAGVVKELRSRMHGDVTRALKKAKVIKDRIEALNRSNAESLNTPGCGPGSATERARTNVVAGLGNKLKAKMDEFIKLRERINEEYKEIVQRRYFTVTGENPDEQTVDLLITTGESESFLQRAIQQQGRGQIQDTIAEIQERHDAVKDIERNLIELQQIFQDMATLVFHQGEQLNDIQRNVERSKSVVQAGTQQLVQARKSQKNTRKWTFFAIILLLIIILVVVLSIRPWQK